MKEKIDYPICPINIYFESDGKICDSTKCDWDPDCRMCTEACIEGKEIKRRSK